MNKLSVIYRACGKEIQKEDFNVSRPKDWFDKRKCFKSFYNNFNKENVDILVVFDGKPEDELSQYIVNNSKISKIKHLPNVGNKESLIYCYNLAEKLDFDYIFFAEDDYLYYSDAYNVLMDGLHNFGEIGPITLYDHPDRYFSNQDITKGHDYIFCCKISHFRTAESTTGTVTMSRNIFNKVKFELINCHIQDCFFYRKILEKYNIRLFSSIPGYSTHVNKFFMSPHKDWKLINNNVKI